MCAYDGAQSSHLQTCTPKRKTLSRQKGSSTVSLHHGADDIVAAAADDDDYSMIDEVLIWTYRFPYLYKNNFISLHVNVIIKII